MWGVLKDPRKNPLLGGRAPPTGSERAQSSVFGAGRYQPVPQEGLSHLPADLAKDISHLSRAVADEPARLPVEKALYADPERLRALRICLFTREIMPLLPGSPS